MHLIQAKAAVDLPLLALPSVLSLQGKSYTASDMALVGALMAPGGNLSCQGEGTLASCRCMWQTPACVAAIASGIACEGPCRRSLLQWRVQQGSRLFPKALPTNPTGLCACLYWEGNLFLCQAGQLEHQRHHQVGCHMSGLVATLLAGGIQSR